MIFGLLLQEFNRQPVYSSEDAIRWTTKATDRKTLGKTGSNGGSRFLVINEVILS